MKHVAMLVSLRHKTPPILLPSTHLDQTKSVHSVVGTATYYPMNGSWCEYRQTQVFSSHKTVQTS